MKSQGRNKSMVQLCWNYDEIIVFHNLQHPCMAYLPFYHKNRINVGKYTSPMDLLVTDVVRFWWYDSTLTNGWDPVFSGLEVEQTPKINSFRMTRCGPLMLQNSGEKIPGPSWWFQQTHLKHIMLVKLDHESPRFRGENEKYLKAPTRPPFGWYVKPVKNGMLNYQFLNWWLYRISGCHQRHYFREIPPQQLVRRWFAGFLPSTVSPSHTKYSRPLNKTTPHDCWAKVFLR